MPKNYSINISDFTGIFHAMAEKANVNGGDTLDAVEISIFNDIVSTYNKKNNTFIYEHEVYNEQSHFTKTPEKPKPIEFGFKGTSDFYIETKNLAAVEKAKKMAKSIAKEQDKVISVDKTINGIPFKFSFKKSDIEKYVMNHAISLTDNEKFFLDINKIKKKPYSQRTKSECKKLNEFNNLINGIVNAGVEYGVDPMLISAIIQIEVKFDGYNESSFGTKGKGYMQITSAPIKDILSAIQDKSKTSRIYLYGKEAEELLIRKGFNINCKSVDNEVKKIKDYLINSNDTDFSIRLGVLILRSHLLDKKGNKKSAANAYNAVNSSYGKKVMTIYNNIKRLSTVKA